MLTPVSAAEAVAFVREWHYTGSATPGILRYGWKVDGELVGVSIFDAGNHAMRAGVYGAEHYRHVLHHHRLALTDSAPKLSESEFIGACLRQIARDRPNIWAVVTYADECEGHVGTIYQATNALYAGVSAKGNLKFLDSDGVIHPTQSIKGTWPERRAYAAEQGWTEIRCKGKHRYVYEIGKPRARRGRPPILWPTNLPYPKKPTTDPNRKRTP